MASSIKFIWSRFKWLFFGAFLKVFLECTTDTVDGILSGNFFSEEAIAGIGLVSPIYFTIYFIGGLVSVGASVQFCQKMGEYNETGAKKVLGEALIVSIFLGVASVLLLIFVRDPYFSLYPDVSAETLFYANSYYTGVIAVAAIYPLYWLIAISVYNDGDVLFATLCEGTRFVFNISCSVLLINITDLGTGALSLGTFISIAAGTLVVSIHFLRKSNKLGFKYQFNLKSIRKSIAIGFSTSLPYLLSAIMIFTFDVYIADAFGDDGLTTYTIVAALVNYLMIWLSLGVAMIPLFSVYYGEKNYQQCKLVCNVCLFFACIGGIITAVLFNLLAPLVPAFYAVETPEIIEAVVYATRFLGIFAIGYTVVIFFVELYSISEKTVIGTLLACLYGSICPFFLTIMLANEFGIYSVIYGYAFAPLLSMAIIAVVLLVVHKTKGFPYYLPNTEWQVSNCVMLIKDTKISLAVDFINKQLLKHKVNKKIMHDIMFVLEEMLTYIYNNNKKRVLCEISLLIEDKKIRLVIRDNGRLFDIQKEDIKINSLNAHVLDSIIGTHDLDYLITTNYNRYTFSFAKNTN